MKNRSIVASRTELSVSLLDTLLFTLITHFLSSVCLCKRAQIPSRCALQPIIGSVASKLSYFNDGRRVLSLHFLCEYLPLCVRKYSLARHEEELAALTAKMRDVGDAVSAYQSDLGSVFDNFKARTAKLRSHTFPEQIDALNNALSDLRKRLDGLADGLDRVEAAQFSAERRADQLRTDALLRVGVLGDGDDDDDDVLRRDSQSVSRAESVRLTVAPRRRRIGGRSLRVRWASKCGWT